VRQREPNADPPLTPEQFVTEMDRLAAYVAGRGMPLLMTSHYRWMGRYLTRYFESKGAPGPVSVPFSTAVPAAGRRISFARGRGRIARPALILASVRVAASIGQLLRSLAGRLTYSATRSVQAYVRENAVASTPLIAAIVIVFLSGDSWKVLGQGFDWQFAVLLAFFLVLSLLIVLSASGLRAFFAAAGQFAGAEAGDAPIGPLVTALDQAAAGPPGDPPFSIPGAVNVAVVYLGIVIANLLLVGMLVVAALVLVGVVRVNAALTRTLSGRPPHILVPLPAGMVVTQELLSLALTLGGLAILSFVVVNLPKRQDREDFVDTATLGLRRVLYAYGVYQAARREEAALTGVSSSPGRDRR
jgi:hypothetical protein